MAQIHVARVGLFQVAPDGSIVNKNNATIKLMLQTAMDHRIVTDSSIPNTAGNPTVKTYLEAEAAAGFVFKHIDQTYVITGTP